MLIALFIGTNKQINNSMNENLNLVEILQDCPIGTMLYSPIFGQAEFVGINTMSVSRIEVK